MNTTKLKVATVAVTLVALVVVMFWQYREIQRRVAEADSMRQQLSQVAALREENQRLAEELRLASMRSQADAGELARLRGLLSQARRAEQENAQSKSKTPVSTRPEVDAGKVSDDQTPEWAVANARMRFSKIIALSTIIFANEHGGQMPTNVPTALASLTEKQFAEMLVDQLPAHPASNEIRPEQFELVFQGNFNGTGRRPGGTMIARGTEPIRLSNGRWARPCVFDDGAGVVLVADSLDELRAKERELMQAPVRP